MEENQVVSLNEPQLEVEGIEECEERLEMRKICGSDCCRSSFYGRC